MLDIICNIELIRLGKVLILTEYLQFGVIVPKPVVGMYFIMDGPIDEQFH